MVVDSGDLFFKNSVADFEKDQMLMKAQLLADGAKASGYEIFVPGESDFLMGWDNFRNLAEKTGASLVASNLKVAGVYPFKRSFIKEVRGVKIGVIGLLDPRYPIPNDGDKQTVIEDPVKTANEMVNDLKTKVDTIVALTHLGLQADSQLCEKTPGIDYVFGGHSGEVLSYPNRSGQSLLYQAGRQGKYVGLARLNVEPTSGGKKKLVALSSELIQMKEGVVENTDFKKRIGEYKKKVDEIGQRTALKPTHVPDSSDVYWGAALCGQCHEKQNKFWKTTVHSRAYETLVNQKKQLDMECLPCHTTGFAALKSRVKAGAKTMVDVAGMEGVQCESCHAPGSKHSTAEIKARALDPKTCTECHTTTRDPKFDYPTRFKLMKCPQSDKL